MNGMLAYIVVVVLSILSALFLAPREWMLRPGDESSRVLTVRLLSRDELSRFDGKSGSEGLYLSILGQVFDVNKGHKHYGPGGGYHFMAGRDASLAFITGDFTESGLSDDVSSLSPLQVVALYDWLALYHRDYHKVGLLIGRFYSETGQPTEALLQVEASLAEGKRMKAQSAAAMVQFPSCNSEWSSAKGGRVWCSTKSGGVERDWMGVPRRLFSAGSTHVRCVCVEDPSAAEDNPNLQRYDGCPSQASSCFVVKF